MKESNLNDHIAALNRLYPQQMGNVAQTLPKSALIGLPVWIKGSVKIFQLDRLGEPTEAFIYLVQPEPELTFEQLMRIYRQLVERFAAPILIIADNLPAKHRPLLVKFNIAFIYKSESIYAPALGLMFNHLKRFQEDRKNRVEFKREALTPFALKLVSGLLTNRIPPEFTLKALHEFLRQEGGEVSAAKLSLTLRDLVNHGLLHASGAGPTRCFGKLNVEKTWEKILLAPIAPFFRQVEINFVQKENTEAFCLAGESALAQYSNLAVTGTATHAMSVREFRASYEGIRSKVPSSYFNIPTVIQIWKEPPHLFAVEGVLNPVELFFSMRNHPDERVQLALDEMLKDYGLVRKEK